MPNAAHPKAASSCPTTNATLFDDEYFYFQLVGLLGIVWILATVWLLYVRPLFEPKPTRQWYIKQLTTHTILGLMTMSVGLIWIDDYMDYLQILMGFIMNLPSTIVDAIVS